ncbi:MAG: YkgJ family cysteine cluster protein [Treponema sp.]|nr:YkgJ family cysteine cluster protein [Treponema sp.]
MESVKNELQNILQKLKGTHTEEILVQMQNLYSQIASVQSEWYQKSGFTCPQGCGECCRNFEPDLLDCEAVHMAAWLLENQPEVAEQVAQGVFPFPQNNGCPFWDENDEYHCTIYGGRAFICRFFGACGSKAKDGSLAFKPCKFYPSELLASRNPPLAHKQYSSKEVLQIFGTLPPVTTAIMESAISLNPDNKSTLLIREILPETIRHLKWICSMAN